MALWEIKIGHGGTQRIQDRVTSVIVEEEFAMLKYTVTIKTPLSSERTQVKGRINDALIQIFRGTENIFDGFIEDVESGADYVKYTGRSFIVMLGYSPNSETDGTSGDTKAEYDGETGGYICDDLIDEFCHHVNGSATIRDSTLTYSDITFTEVFDGEVKIHGAQKVYDVIKNMTSMYGKDVWASATWDGTTLTNKNIHIGDRSRGNAGAPHKTLTGGVNIDDIPIVKYRSSQAINCLRVIGKGSGKEQIAVWVQDDVSVAAIGYVEGVPYKSNLIISEDTATAIGNTIITAKKDPILELKVNPIIYINDLKYGDWVRILDSYSGIDTTKRIKKITYIYSANNIDSMKINLGDKFDNYENIIRDLTKGDIDSEPEMTKLGGSFQLTTNDPPGDWIRYDKGVWYDTTGTFQEKLGKGVVPFWTYVDNPATGTYKKALIQISNAGAISYKVGTQQTTALLAEGTAVSVDALNTPLGEVILKGKAVGGGGYTVEDVYSDDQGDSYIYRDVRPIIGSSSTGYGGEPMWEVDGTETQLVTPDSIDMQGHGIINISDLKGSLNADFSLHGSNTGDTDWIEFLQWDHSTEQVLINRNTDLYDASTISPRLKFRVPLDEGYSGIYIDYHSVDGMLRFRNITGDTDVVTFADTGRVNLIDDLWMTKGKEINFGTPNTAYIYQDAATNDLKFYDSVLAATKTLSELAAGGVPSGGVHGDIIYHDAADWVRLAAGTSGYVLQSQGAAANPVWGKGLPTSPAQGDVVYYNGSNWTSLAAGSSGSYLKTLGAGNNPIWFNVTAGFVTDPLTSDLDGNGYDIYDFGDLNFRTSLSYAYINFDSGDDFLRYDCTADTFEFKINNNIRFSIELEEINCHYDLDMNNKDIIAVDDLIFTGSSSYIDLNGGDIIDCDEIKGTSTVPCHLDFRGDDAHRIWYTGSADNKVQYKTYLSHEFVIQTVDVLEVKTTGIHMKAGKYLKSDSGDLELRAPSGSKIKFVIG